MTGPTESYSAVVERALYGPDGFYTAGGGARDFLTSPELGPMFGAVVANAVRSCWDALGRPAGFTVVEAAAGRGALAGALTSDDWRYVAVERSAALRAQMPAHVEALEDLPPGPLTGVVFANELLDNLPFDVYERGAEGWKEVQLDAQRSEHLVENPVVAARLDALAPGARIGARVPWQTHAQQWVARARASLVRGRVIAVDYARTTREMADRGGWLRTYRAGGPGRAPLEDLGGQDITVDVAIDQLDPSTVASQEAWLRANGIDALKARAWDERGERGSLAELRAYGAIGEVSGLLDPLHLGGFCVLEWEP